MTNNAIIPHNPKQSPALNKVSKALSITDKLLPTAPMLTDEDWAWWRSLSPFQQYSLYYNSSHDVVNVEYIQS